MGGEGGKDFEIKTIAETDAFTEEVEGGFAGKESGDAEPAVGAGKAGLGEVGEIAPGLGIAFNVFAAVLGEHFLGELAFEEREADFDFDGGEGEDEEGGEHGKGKTPSWAWGLLYVNWATSYSPTQSPVQYHRGSEA